ncbi:MAG: Crp/Fnr family transcriptional regulator [Rubrivivax sp.]|jgi:CRP-like cAMP-binding protein
MQHSFQMPEGALAERPARPPLRPTTTARPSAVSVRDDDRPETRGPDARTWQGLFGTPALSTAEQLALSSVARMRTVPAGAAVFDRRDSANALVLVQSGDVALGYRGADGVFHIERPVRGPAWLDQSSAWLHENHALDARATTEAVIVELPRDAVQALIERYPALGRHLVASLAREVQTLQMNTHELMHKDAPARFAAWLVQRIELTDAAGLRGVVRLTERKRDIASQLAITPETLSRLMRSLTRQGVISVAGYNVQVLDAPALRQIATGG